MKKIIAIWHIIVDMWYLMRGKHPHNDEFDCDIDEWTKDPES